MSYVVLSEAGAWLYWSLSEQRAWQHADAAPGACVMCCRRGEREPAVRPVVEAES